MAAQAAPGGGSGGECHLLVGVWPLCWSVARGPYNGCWAAGSLTERAGGNPGHATSLMEIPLPALLPSRENAKRLGI